MVVRVVRSFVIISVQSCFASRSDVGNARHRRRSSTVDAARGSSRRCRQLEVSPVVGPKQRWTSRVILSEVGHVLVGSSGHVTALFAHVDLVTALLVREVELASVNFTAMRLERTALSEGLIALDTSVRTNTCK